MVIGNFVEKVRCARFQCSNKHLFLELILAEKITGHARRSLRYLRITTYEELHDALRSNLSTLITVTSTRKHLEVVM